MPQKKFIAITYVLVTVISISASLHLEHSVAQVYHRHTMLSNEYKDDLKNAV